MVTQRPKVLWWSESLNDGKRILRRLERKWRKSNLDADHLSYSAMRKTNQDNVSKAKKDHFSNVIGENADNPKKLWKVLNTLLHCTTSATEEPPSKHARRGFFFPFHEQG